MDAGHCATATVWEITAPREPIASHHVVSGFRQSNRAIDAGHNRRLRFFAEHVFDLVGLEERRRALSQAEQRPSILDGLLRQDSGPAADDVVREKLQHPDDAVIPLMGAPYRDPSTNLGLSKGLKADRADEAIPARQGIRRACNLGPLRLYHATVATRACSGSCDIQLSKRGVRLPSWAMSFRGHRSIRASQVKSPLSRSSSSIRGGRFASARWFHSIRKPWATRTSPR